MTSAELLQRYARDRDQSAFSQFVQQHFDFVYATALRQAANDPHLAHDITQSVFLAAAQHASTLSRHASLLGWLHTATRHQASRHIRTQRRWQAREQNANAMNDATTTPSTDELWQQLRPLLDDALHSLNAADREALLLRYFENHSYSDIGRQLGLAENSARMRVDRALEKIRRQLSHRGLTSTAVALGTVLSSHALHAAPVGLALQTAAVINQTAVPATFLSSLLLKLQLMNSLKLTALSLVFAGAATYGLIAATTTPTPVHVEEKIVGTVSRSEVTAPPSSSSRQSSVTPVPADGPAKLREARPSREMLFMLNQNEEKISLTEEVIKRLQLTPAETKTLQADIKHAWDELDSFAARNAAVQTPIAGQVVITISPFGEGADVYDQLLAAFARTLGESRNKEFLVTTASALEHNLKYCGATTRTFTITKALNAQGELMDYEVVDTWTSAYRARGKGTRRYKTRENFAHHHPHLAKLLPADFR